MWFSGEQLGIEMAQRDEAALPGLGVLLLPSQYLVFFFKPQLLESSNERKIHQLLCKKAAEVMGEELEYLFWILQTWGEKSHTLVMFL